MLDTPEQIHAVGSLVGSLAWGVLQVVGVCTAAGQVVVDKLGLVHLDNLPVGARADQIFGLPASCR